MIIQFHLSFPVPDIEQAKEFYVGLLGCDTGRDNKNWVDILFFGHQLTIHQQNENMPAVAIDHFGPVLDKKEWLSISEKCAAEKVNFILVPTVKDEGAETEAGKFIINDPAGNVLEF